MRTIEVHELAELKKSESVDVIDVRTPVEFRAVHVEGAVNRPLDRLDPQELIQSRNGRSDEPLYLICRSGKRSEKAVQKFHQAGIDNVISVDGGTSAWAEAGFPVVRGKSSMSLERQVRIAAGFLVLLGVVLAQLIHPGFMWLSGFVGAGLMFAGITDTCGMGMVLAKMPWNQCADESCSV